MANTISLLFMLFSRSMPGFERVLQKTREVDADLHPLASSLIPKIIIFRHFIAMPDEQNTTSYPYFVQFH
jgi:hypothetical protein